MKLAVLIVTICLASSSLGSPTDNDSLLWEGRAVDFGGNTRLLVEELIQNLRNSAQQAFDAVKTFSAGLREQSKLFSEKVVNDLQNVRVRVQRVIKNTSDRFSNAGSAVRNCIDSHTKEVDNIFNNTVEKSKQCAGNRIKEIRIMIENLQELSSNATAYASVSVAQLKACTENGQGLLSTGTCLGGIAIRTELRGAVFLTRSGFLLSRINLAITTLPAALDICAGTKLVEAGVQSAKVVMEVGTCSASSIYSSLIGNAST